MTFRLLEPTAMAAAEWPAGTEKLRAFAEGFAKLGSERLIANLRTRIAILSDGDFALPVTVNDSEQGNTYVCSPYNAYTVYSKEELRLIGSRLARAALGALADTTGSMLKAARVDRILHVNNWMLSTNLFPPRIDWPVEGITEALIALHPDHYVCIRSLNPSANAPLIRQFKRAGYKLVASRQVYIFDDLAGSWARTSNARHDRHLLERTAYRVVPHHELGEADYDRMADLYRLLYIGKYSHHNPVFTSDYMRLCHRSGNMTFFGLRSPDGILDGVLGLFIVDGIVTAPIVGYDTARNLRLGLYRLLMTLVFEHALKEGCRINLSSGAASFKRLRGGRPYIEYSAFYDRHLSFARRMAITALAIPVNGLGIPLMRTLKL